MKVGRGAVVVLSWLLLGAATAACNAITGQHERTLADSDNAAQPGRIEGGSFDVGIGDGDGGMGLPDQLVPGDADGAPKTPITINVPQSWSTPNGAIFTTNASGTMITNWTSPAGHHPEIVPSPPVDIPTDDYDLEATILAPTSYEFGILVRIQPNGNGIVYGSLYATVTPAYLGKLGPMCCPEPPPVPADPWNPTKEGTGPTYTLVAGTRYKMKMRAVGTQITAKLWVATQAEPTQWHASIIAPWSTGKGIGFYTYYNIGQGPTGVPVLESMKVTTIP